MLKRITSRLVDVHGQSEHFYLLKSANQLELIDKCSDEIYEIKNQIHDVFTNYKNVLVELDKLGPSEEEFYKEYCNNVEGLLDELEERGELDMLHEDSVLNVSKVFFSHLLGGTPIKNTVPVWEPSNFRLVWEPWTRSSCYYLNAMSASDVCMLLNLTRQQLHYYVTTGAIKKEYNPEIVSSLNTTEPTFTFFRRN
jgi:hypothetical protein